MKHQVVPSDPAAERINSEAFSSLNENAPCLMRILGKGAGLSITDLRKMASEGQLTSAVLVDGLKNASMDTPAMFQGEAIIPKVFNPWSEVLSLGGELRAMRAETKTLAERCARTLGRWDDDGPPGCRADT